MDSTSTDTPTEFIAIPLRVYEQERTRLYNTTCVAVGVISLNFALILLLAQYFFTERSELRLHMTERDVAVTQLNKQLGDAQEHLMAAIRTAHDVQTELEKKKAELQDVEDRCERLHQEYHACMDKCPLARAGYKTHE